MRKIILPRLVRSFSISEYAPEIADEKIYVWVNPPISALLSLMESFGAYVQSGDEQLNPYLEKLSAILSQGAEGTGWNADELMEMVKETADTDPQFWIWFNNRVLQEIKEHRLLQKKK